MEATIHPSDCYCPKMNMLHTSSSAEWDFTMSGIIFLDYTVQDNKHLFQYYTRLCTWSPICNLCGPERPGPCSPSSGKWSRYTVCPLASFTTFKSACQTFKIHNYH